MSDIAHTVSSIGVSRSGRWQYTRSRWSRPNRSRDGSMASSRYFRLSVVRALTPAPGMPM